MPSPLSASAKRLWVAFHDHVERQLGDEGPLAPVRGFANKAAEHAARLAGVLTLVDNLAAAEINAAHMQAGITLAQFYLTEALRLVDAGATDQDLLLAEKLLAWAQEHEHIYLRQIYQFGPNSIREAKTAKRLVSILEEHGWLIRVEGGMELDGAHRARRVEGLAQCVSTSNSTSMLSNFRRPPATSATAATPQEQSSESSTNSMEVPPLSRYCTPEERVQSIADVERGDLHDGDRGLATFATPATQVRQSSGSSESSNLSPLDTHSTMTTPCQHTPTIRRRDRSDAGEAQIIPIIPPISHRPNSSRACYACGTTRRWRSIYDVLICATCYPPADVALVATWEEGDAS